MQQTMIRVLYASTAHEDITEAAVEDIVAKAAKANELRGVTGALAFNGVRFCQCLEGNTDTVHRLLARISQDHRHSDLTVLAEIPIETRYFDGWAMRWVFDHSFTTLRDAMEPQPLPKFS